ncbi:hypothetical protein TKWG_24360 [Advenella kashmirensis WT001]|uniref:Uncharacterized protein n=1 Tax=Advenella kashmirensis (strain DSM 17095 / LMG 22695 / WT001) TaxID=1036672 RepID=I3UHE3_ADVKW|nr:hypothetical protein TKWG_24360 [Advenella kashmirensis WT001]
MSDIRSFYTAVLGPLRRSCASLRFIAPIAPRHSLAFAFRQHNTKFAAYCPPDTPRVSQYVTTGRTMHAVYAHSRHSTQAGLGVRALAAANHSPLKRSGAGCRRL